MTPSEDLGGGWVLEHSEPAPESAPVDWIADLEPVALDIAAEAVNHWKAVQKPHEFAALLTQVMRRDRPTSRILEIGSEKGGTLRAWRTLFPDAAVISVSLSLAEFAAQPDFRLDGPGLADHWIDAPSQHLDTIKEVMHQFEGEAPDVVFIDGSHRYTDSLVDAARYGAQLEPGGILAMHDIVVHPHFPECEVWRTWAEVKAGVGWYDVREYVGQPDTWGGIGTVTRI